MRAVSRLMVIVVTLGGSGRCGELRIDAFRLVAINALELSQVAQIDRMLEWPVSFVTIGAFQPRHLAQVNRMREPAVLRGAGCAPFGLVQHGVADITVSPD